MAKVSTVKVSTLLNWQDNPRSIKKNRFEELKVRIKKHGFNDVLKVAADKLDRTCYMMEIDPKYCDVIRKRYAKLKDPEGWEEKWQQMTPKVQ